MAKFDDAIDRVISEAQIDDIRRQYSVLRNGKLIVRLMSWPFFINGVPLEKIVTRSKYFAKKITKISKDELKDPSPNKNWGDMRMEMDTSADAILYYVDSIDPTKRQLTEDELQTLGYKKV